MAPPSPPHWRGLQDSPAMRDLAQRHHRDFWHWLNDIKLDQSAQHRSGHDRSSASHERLDLTRFVNAYEHRLGRRVRPFTLHLRLLPLQQPAGWVLDEHQVLLSTTLREDTPALKQLLEPVVSALG
ncbi:hypothetical protein MO973_45210 [Paenibacillus sp. TRM 82003]|nr:hypothetical protein [Paenibacillus sp. TRM 82003]